MIHVKYDSAAYFYTSGLDKSTIIKFINLFINFLLHIL